VPIKFSEIHFLRSFAIALFVALPTFVVKFIPGIQDNHFILNLVEGAIRLALFLLYIWGIGQTKDIQRVFQYHGAEHKTIHAYENDLPLTVENVRAQSRLHPRCGTNFLLIVMVVSIFVFAFWIGLFCGLYGIFLVIEAYFLSQKRERGCAIANIVMAIPLLLLLLGALALL